MITSAIPFVTASAPYEALYHLEEEGDQPGTGWRLPVLAWDTAGQPLVAQPGTGRLVPASSLEGFRHVDGPHPRLVGVVPGGGWSAQPDAWADSPSPVICWLVDSHNQVRPVVLGEDGRPVVAGNGRHTLVPPVG
jgi:hypothetical protein